MTKRVFIIISLALAAVLLLAACEKSASKLPQATPTVAGAASTPQPLGLQVLNEYGTKTAMYVQTQVAAGVFTPVATTDQTQATPTPQGALSTPEAATVAPVVPLPSTTPIAGATAVPAQVIVFASPTPGHPASYTLHAGEFPYCIARRFDVNPGDLMNANGLSAGQILQPGKTLNIPATGSFPGTRALQVHPVQYTVAVNDTFYNIACAFGDVDPSAIAAANGLAITAPLTTGQVLNIP
jgi:LysM repeat protein